MHVFKIGILKLAYYKFSTLKKRTKKQKNSNFEIVLNKDMIGYLKTEFKIEDIETEKFKQFLNEINWLWKSNKEEYKW